MIIMMIMICLIMLATNTIFVYKVRITLPRRHVKLLKDFIMSKGGKNEKTHKLCIIMLINSL